MGAERSGPGGSSAGESLEVTGRRWALRVTERMRAGRERAVLIVRETGEYRRRLVLPTLTGEEEAAYNSIWFDEVGRMYVARWPIKKTEFDDEGKRYLVRTEGQEYRVLNRRRLRCEFFDNLPKHLPVRELVLDEVKSDIETAIRKTRHILQEYAPGTEAYEVVLARRVIEYTDRIAHRFISGRVTKADLERLARETGEFLEEIGLVDPHDPDKQKVQENLLKVPLRDRLGRINPLVARVRARAAFLAATKRLVVGGMIVRKFATIEQVLIYERETTRWSMQTGNNQLGVLLGHADFGRPDGAATKLQRAAIANILFDISQHHLALPRVRAYLAAARYAAINLIGCREHLREVNRQILGDEMADELFARTPVRHLIIDGKFSEAGHRIEESRTVIKVALGKYESIEEKTT